MFRLFFIVAGLSILWTDLVHLESDLEAREAIISHTKSIDVRASGLLYLVSSAEFLISIVGHCISSAVHDLCKFSLTKTLEYGG